MEIRDKSGNLVMYDGAKPGCVFGEVLAVKINERMGRIESNLGDARIDLQKISADMEHLKEQTAGACSLARELKNGIEIYSKIQEDANHENRIRIIEGHVKFVQGACRLVLWVVSPVIAITGFVLGYLKIKGGH